MKSAGKFTLGASLTLLTASIAGAATLAIASNPYSAIPERNVFALVPIPVAVPVDPDTLKDPPPKITPNGTMNLFGQMQVLFKVTPKPVAGQPNKDESYVMAEGERQNDITVVKIDAAAGIITFNNHGKIQELALVEAPKGSIGAVPVPAVTSTAGAIPAPASATPATPAAFAARLKARGATGTTPEAAPSTSPAVTTATAGNAAPAKTETLTPEEQAILVEAQRAVWKEQANPAASILPPTKQIIGDIDVNN